MKRKLYRSKITIEWDNIEAKADSVEHFLEMVKSDFKNFMNIELERKNVMIYGVDDQ